MGYGDEYKAFRGYEVDLLSQKSFQVGHWGVLQVLGLRVCGAGGAV